MSFTCFTHAPMRAGKTAQLITLYDTFTEHSPSALEGEGSVAYILRPSIDTRSPAGKVKSRNGEERDAYTFHCYTSLMHCVDKLLDANPDKRVYFLLDEVQFVSKQAIERLIVRAKYEGFMLFMYGLLLDAEQHPFQSSLSALCGADEVREMHADCECCGRAFGRFMRRKDPNKRGAVIEVGDRQYIRVCANCMIKETYLEKAY